MPIPTVSLASFGHRTFLVITMIIAAHVHAQTTPPPENAAPPTQTKNDVKKAEETVKLTPFQVTTSKDVGYAAGNTLSGGRVDTPLAITPGSISVMTKEFMDDFNVTNINGAGAWTIGYDLGTAVPNSNPSAISTYQVIFRGAPSDQNFPTRNGSIYFGVADSYNTERFEFNRGPDTSMFGDGGPGGRQSSTSKRATFNQTATTLSTQIDSYRGYRGTLDYSKGWDRLGLRVNAVGQDNKAYQDGVDRLKNAATINAVVKITDNTQLVAEYERVGELNNLYSVTLGDAHNIWDGITVNNDNTPIAGNVGSALTALGVEQLSATNDYYVWNYGSNSFQNYKGNQYQTRGFVSLANWRIPFNGNPNNPPTRTPTVPGISKRFNLATADNVANRDTDLTSFTLEHHTGNLFAQLGFVQNHYDTITSISNTSPNQYRVDINKLLPDGKPNPDFLRAYTDVQQSRIYNEDRIREFKGLVTYRFFVPQFFDYKQQLSFNTGYRETHNEAWGDSWRRVDNPLQADPFNAANAVRYRVYWYDPRPSLSPIFSNPNGVLPGKWVEAQDSGIETDRSVKYAGLISQSAFLNERVALTASVRRDDVGVDNLPRFGADANFQNVLGNGAPGVHFKRTEKATSTSYGLVAYPFPEHSNTWVNPLGIVFNHAGNVQPPGATSAAPLVDGNPIPLTKAKTMDIGLRYSMPGGKAYMTLTHYNTDSRGIINAFGNQAEIQTIWTNLGYTDPKLTSSGFNYSDTSARKLEGWEIELTANPTRNLTLTVNYSHPLVFIEDDSPGRRAYVAAHRAEWVAGGNATAGTVINGHTILNPQLIKDSLQAIDNSLDGFAVGALADNTARHRVNFAVAYHVREGKLKGLGVNYGFNYRGITKSAGRDTRLKFGVPESVTPTAAQDRAAAFDYLYAPSTIVHTAGINYTHRFGRYVTRFQLNIENLTDNDKPIWGRNGAGDTGYITLPANYLQNGNPRMQVLANFGQYDPRKFIFTTTVSF